MAVNTTNLQNISESTKLLAEKTTLLQVKMLSATKKAILLTVTVTVTAPMAAVWAHAGEWLRKTLASKLHDSSPAYS